MSIIIKCFALAEASYSEAILIGDEDAGLFAYAQIAFIAFFHVRTCDAVRQIFLHFNAEREVLLLQQFDVNASPVWTAPKNDSRPTLNLKDRPAGAVFWRLPT